MCKYLLPQNHSNFSRTNDTVVCLKHSSIFIVQFILKRIGHFHTNELALMKLTGRWSVTQWHVSHHSCWFQTNIPSESGLIFLLIFCTSWYTLLLLCAGFHFNTFCSEFLDVHWNVCEVTKSPAGSTLVWARTLNLIRSCCYEHPPMVSDLGKSLLWLCVWCILD